MSTALADAEAKAFFAVGHCFTIRADAVAGCTISADSLVRHGVTSPQEIASTLTGHGS